MTTTEKLAEALRNAMGELICLGKELDSIDRRQGVATLLDLEVIEEIENALAFYESEQAEAKLPITHGLRLSGCKDHPDESRDLSCLGIRREDGTRLSWREVWELMRSTEPKREV